MFRKMRRFKQQLPEAQCVEILKSEPRGVLAVLGDEGYPYAVPLDFIYKDGKLFFHSAMEGHKVDALRACDKASFCVMDQGEPVEGDWALWFNSVICFGRVRLVEDREETIRIARDLGLKYYPNEQDVEDEIRKDGHRVLCMELTIEHMTGKHVHEK